MDLDAYNLKIVLILTVGFGIASILGYISQRIKLSPILGYLITGYLIGPYSPGFVADLSISEQLAEIGVILMMFEVGLHFKWQDLMSVKWIAIPGAILQTIFTAIIGFLIITSLGWSSEAGIIFGIAIAVASTVVLVRGLADNHLLGTPQGHISVGWLIVEDVLTVIALILLPYMSAIALKEMDFSFLVITKTISFILLKFAILIAIMFTIGRRFVSYILFNIARTRSHELFTLTVLAMTFVIATGSALLFGTSIALGAFIAGMVIGQTEVRHQVSANALPMKDAFVVIFFLSVGMLFNPGIILTNFSLFICILAIIVIIKPLLAFLIAIALRQPLKVALTLAVALAQIGEFSFIIGVEAMKFNIIPDELYDIIVACALISISLNPLLFLLIKPLNEFLKGKTSFLSAEHVDFKYPFLKKRRALVVGYGSLGRNVADTLEKVGFSTTIIDRNVDIVSKLRDNHRQAIFGDASQPSILETAEIENAKLLVVTVQEIVTTLQIINVAHQINPKIHIVARREFKTDEHLLGKIKVHWITSEEQTEKAFDDILLRYSDLGISQFVT